MKTQVTPKGNWLKLSAVATAVCTAMIAAPTFAAEEKKEKKADDVERIAVVGTQIRGGQMAESLAVSVIGAEDIEQLGIDSGDELLDLIPENGQNFFSEAENISGGINSARGDIGAFNLRNLGTGNTLVLLNGRRLVNAASFQTEEVGGSFVPVNTVNSNAIPVSGLDRVEVLRDGASAIYGADAVAGVVNYVLKSDFVGFKIRAKHAGYDNVARKKNTLTIEWGDDFNDGRTNISSYLNYYTRDRVSASEDPRWADSDFRDRIPEDSPWAGSTKFRNNSINSLYGQFDLVSSASSSGLRNRITDSSGEFEVFPVGHENCEFAINSQVCGAIDGNGTVRYNLNEFRDVSSELTRTNFFTFVNHEFENGMEGFTEISLYDSTTSMYRQPSASFSSSKLRVGAENYYNPLGPITSPNRLPESVIGDRVPDGGMALTMDYYRFAEVPRIVDNDGNSIRLLQGLRGELGDWSWESAVAWSKAEKTDITRNRVSNTLMQEALNDPTENAYNPFSAGVDSNIERALIDVKRISETELTSFDIKFANPDMFELLGGMAGLLVGYEFREESFVDDRDDRLDGTITFTDWEGDTYPYVSDVVNSSPTPDNSGSRTVSSLFTEMQLPVLDNLDVQVALRYEDFSDVESATVGKLAFGYRPFESLLLRGSWSQAFRAPNLVTVNEEIVARNVGTTDYVCQYAAENGGDPDQDILDCGYSIQRIAEGSDLLKPEESTNTSLGLVLTPTEDLTFTIDYWSIEKDNTIGLFGEENHTMLDLMYRLESGDSCNTNPAVNRSDDIPADELAIYQAAGICPAGTIENVLDQYANLDTRTVKGFDVGFYYDLETSIGKFKFKYNGSFLDTFEQKAGGDSAKLVAAQQAGDIPAHFPVDGFADLIGKDGNQDQRHNFKLSWRHDSWGASFSGNQIGEFYQSSLSLTDSETGDVQKYIIPSMTTYDATVDYRFNISGASTRVRLGVKNLTDERAPLADRYFGFFADAHNDYGRNYYIDVKTSF